MESKTKILVPTDFSPTAEKALKYALHVAAKSKGEIFLCHIYTPVSNPFIETVSERSTYNYEYEQELMSDLHALRAKVGSIAPEVKITTVLGRSPLVGSIAQFAEVHDIDMIIMGTQGASGLKKAVVGTVAVRIIEKITIPILLIPEEYEWQPPKSLVLATGYHQDDREALYVAGTIAAMFGASIKVVHLVDIDKEDPEKATGSFEEYAGSLQTAAEKLPLTHELLPVKSVSEGLTQLANEIPFDMLIMVKRQKTFFQKFYMESMTNQVAYLTQKPLLVIPAKS